MAELDLTHVITRLREIELLTSMFMKPHMKTLLAYQRKNTLKEDSSSDEEAIKFQSKSVVFNGIGKRSENLKYFGALTKISEDNEPFGMAEKHLIYGLLSREPSSFLK